MHLFSSTPTLLAVICVAASLAGGEPAPAPSSSAAPAAPAQSTAPNEIEQAVLDATNAERQKAGLDPLKSEPLLMQAARQHSANMAAQNNLAHVLDGKGVEDRVQTLGYKYFRVGENVAYNDPNAQAVVDSWMKSPGHRENILTKEFTEIGIGVAKNAAGEPYYTQVFGRSQSAGPTARATVTIKNETDAPIQITLPGNPAKSTLGAGHTGRFTVAGTGELPDATLEINGQRRSVAMKDKAVYTVTSSRRGIDIATEPPKDEAR